MNKFACVTGADRGLGLELVSQLLTEGYVVFAGHILEVNYKLKALREEYKDTLHIINLDISEDESVKEATKYITTKTDKLDILINNGAILGDIKSTILDDLDFDEMQKVFNINTLGSLRVSNNLVSLLLKSDTKLIVNISSEAGSIRTSNRRAWFAYCMSKAALNMQSVLVHNEIKHQGGQVLIIHPGWMKTYMQGKLDENAELAPEEVANSIINIVFEYDKYAADKPAFVDYLGNKMEW